MRIPTSVGYALSAAAAIALLAGCSGSGSVAPAQSSNPTMTTTMVNGHVLQRSYSVLPKSMQQQLLNHPTPLVKVSPSKKKHHKPAVDVYVSSFSGSVINCYDNTDKKGASDGSITSGLINPQGEAASAGKGSQLLVANTGAFNILEFSGECGAKLTRTMNDTPGFPVGVTEAADGVIYVSNIFDTAANGEVRKYAVGDNTGVTIGDPNLTEDFFIATNKADTRLCVDGFNLSGLPEVDCTTNGGGTWTNNGNVVSFPGGLAFEKDDSTLVVDDQLGTISDGTTTISCPGSDCVNIAFSKNDVHLDSGDAGTSTGHQIDWPSGSLDFDDAGGPSTISAQPVPGG